MVRSPALRRVLVVAVALAVAACATLKLKAYLEERVPREEVLVAKNDIPPYSVITAEDLHRVSLPVGSRVEGSLQDPGEIVGKLAAAAIYRGEQILPQKVSEAQLALAPGERAVGVPVDLVRSAGMTVKPGDRVDVFWVPGEGSGLPGKGTGVREAELVAEGATVLEVVKKESGGTPEERRQTKAAGDAVAVLKVRETEARSVVTAVGNGQVYLAKRR